MARGSMKGGPVSEHSAQAGAATSFVRKLFTMVTEESDDIICFVPDGKAFEVKDPRRLEGEVLPKYFRHSRFQSLVRQLNFYSFKKISKERSIWIYKHDLFQREKPQQLRGLKRKTNQSAAAAAARAAAMSSGSSASGRSGKSSGSGGGGSSRPAKAAASRDTTTDEEDGNDSSRNGDVDEPEEWTHSPRSGSRQAAQNTNGEGWAREARYSAGFSGTLGPRPLEKAWSGGGGSAREQQRQQQQQQQQFNRVSRGLLSSVHDSYRQLDAEDEQGRNLNGKRAGGAWQSLSALCRVASGESDADDGRTATAAESEQQRRSDGSSSDEDDEEETQSRVRENMQQSKRARLGEGTYMQCNNRGRVDNGCGAYGSTVASYQSSHRRLDSNSGNEAEREELHTQPQRQEGCSNMPVARIAASNESDEEDNTTCPSEDDARSQPATPNLPPMDSILAGNCPTAALRISPVTGASKYAEAFDWSGAVATSGPARSQQQLYAAPPPARYHTCVTLCLPQPPQLPLQQQQRPAIIPTEEKMTEIEPITAVTSTTTTAPGVGDGSLPLALLARFCQEANLDAGPLATGAAVGAFLGSQPGVCADFASYVQALDSTLSLKISCCASGPLAASHHQQEQPQQQQQQAIISVGSDKDTGAELTVRAFASYAVARLSCRAAAAAAAAVASEQACSDLRAACCKWWHTAKACS